MNLARISAFAAPLAAMAFGALALSACGASEEEKLAQNGYTVPSERDASSYPAPSVPSTSPVTPATPDSTVPTTRPADPDAPAPLPPGSPPPPLPN
ncbi:MAG TPA: hypothetical protein VGO52_09935 [Hyphomonadaceae bacterium]|jgi:hypothetical protein|nr:hypothetical protein [Hyphomonadaceae bacterium]